jgi:hypothetical protein
MYGLKPVPFKDGTLLFLELGSTEFAVISVHQQGMEITVNGVENRGGSRRSSRPVFSARRSAVQPFSPDCPGWLF